MALFRRRSGGGTVEGRSGRWGLGGSGRRAAAPTLDPTFGDDGLALLLAQARALDWEALRDGLAAVTDETRQLWLLGHLADVQDTEKWLPKAVAGEPDSVLPLLLSGARHISWGWEARTGARAQHVTEEQWQVFHERLFTAEEQLYEVAEREPGLLAPWYFLLISARGASHGPDVARHRFEAAERRSPGNPEVHRQRLQQLTAKWGGSHEEMHAFARAGMLAAPEGSPLGVLVAEAHLEHWLDLPDGEDHAYITDPGVAAQLHEAARRSVLHPAHGRPPGWLRSLNTFAMAFSLAGERQAAHSLFEVLDGRVVKGPWHYLGDPVEAFRVHRDRCAP